MSIPNLLPRMHRIYRAPAVAREAARRVAAYERYANSVVPEWAHDRRLHPAITVFAVLRPVDDADGRHDPYRHCEIHHECPLISRKSLGTGPRCRACESAAKRADRSQRRAQA